MTDLERFLVVMAVCLVVLGVYSVVYRWRGWGDDR